MDLAELVTGTKLRKVGSGQKVTELEFCLDGKEYLATVAAFGITLSVKDWRLRFNSIATYNREEAKTYWELEHCCGLSGFGGGPGDICYACKTPGKKMEATPENIGIVYVHGKYRPELARILSSDIDNYCRRIEERLQF